MHPAHSAADHVDLERAIGLIGIGERQHQLAVVSCAVDPYNARSQALRGDLNHTGLNKRLGHRDRNVVRCVPDDGVEPGRRHGNGGGGRDFQIVKRMLPHIAVKCAAQQRDEVGPEPGGLDIFRGAACCDNSSLTVDEHANGGRRCAVEAAHLNLDANLEVILRDAVGEPAVARVDACAAVKNLDIAVVAEQDAEAVGTDDPRVFRCGPKHDCGPVARGVVLVIDAGVHLELDGERTAEGEVMIRGNRNPLTARLRKKTQLARSPLRVENSQILRRVGISGHPQRTTLSFVVLKAKVGRVRLRDFKGVLKDEHLFLRERCAAKERPQRHARNDEREGHCVGSCVCLFHFVLEWFCL